MSARGHVGPKARTGGARAASSVFRVSPREEALALEAVKRLAARSPGRPVDESTREEFEEALGCDFARVRIHTDDAAAEIAELLAADAVTVGKDIYFAAGEYRPGDPVATELLAHELAHVAQQGDAPTAEPGGRVAEADEPLEQLAEALGREATRNEPVAQEPGALVDRAALSIALRAARRTRRAPPKEPTLPVGDMRIVERLAGVILGDFWKDPDDKGGRVRNMLERLGERTHAEVLEVIDARLADADKARFSALLALEPPLGAGVQTAIPTADDSSREQRQERSEEENADTRNRDPCPETEARAPGEEQGEPKSDHEEKAAGADAAADKETGEGADEDEEKADGKSFFQKLGDAVKKTFGLKRTKKTAKKQAKGKERHKGEAKAEQPGEKPPQKPALEKGESKGPEGGEEKPEGAEVETPQGAGEAERPSADSSAEGPVDTSPFDRLLAERMQRSRARQGAAGAHGALMRGGAAPGPMEAMGAEAKPATSAEATGSEAGGAGMGAAPMPASGGAPEAAAADHDSGAEAHEAAGHAEETHGGGAAPAAEGAPSTEAHGAGAASAASEPNGNAPAPEAHESAASKDAEPSTAASEGAASGGEAAAGGGGGESAPGEPAAGAEPGAKDAAEPAPGGGETPAAAPEVGPSAAERQPAAGQTGPAAADEKSPASGAMAPARTAETPPAAAGETSHAQVAAGAEPGAEAEHAPEHEASPAESGGGESTAAAGAAGEGGEAGGASEAGPESTAASGGEAAGPEASAGGFAPAEGGGFAPASGEGMAASGPESPGGDLAMSEGGGDAGGELVDGGGGGGGGGSAIEDKPEPAAPDVSQAAPADAMAAMAGLPPATVQSALGGVSAASDRAVAKQRDDLEQSPPQVQRPSGAPADHAPTADPAQLAGKLPKGAAGKVDPLAAGKTAPAPTPPPAPELGAPPKLPSPAIPGDGPLEHQNLQALQSAVGDLPTTDPALHVTVGEAPKLVLAGEADPNRTAEQRGKNEEAAQKELQQGAKDAAHPMGEDAVYPHSPPETLKAEIPKGGGGGGQGAAAGAGAPTGGSGTPAGGAGAGKAEGGGGEDAAASIVAKEQHGEELAAQVDTNSAEMRAAQEKQDADAKTQKDESQKKVDDAISGSAKDQEQARREVKGKVAHQREEWTDGQGKAVKTAREKGDAASADADKEVATRRREGEEGAQKEIQKGDADITKERQKAEQTAREQRQKAKQESDQGFIAWIGSKVKSFFNAIKQAISAAFDAARNAIKAVIKKAQELAVAVIDAARNAIVAAIKAAGALLIEIGNVMLAAFPELREKFKKAIHALVDLAIKAVDALADALKKTVVGLLNLLGKALDALLGLLLAALKALVDAVAAFVKKIIAAAKAVMQALGAFWALIKDVAANPGQWIRNLGGAVVDGIKNHLIKAFKTTIKKWFNDTVESVIGVGKMILKFLRKGGITFAKVVKMAWDAMKAAIPPALIQLLIEKLVAMIVPAAGALMTIIEGVKAAWGSIQQIVAAFETFFKFLKAVKGGGAGPLFAESLAAAAIVVIQFVAQWLLGKLKGAGAKVGGKLKELAQKIMAGLKKGAKAAGAAAKRAAQAIVRGVKKGVGLAKQGATRLGGKLKKGAAWLGAKAKKVIQKIANHPIVKKILNSPIVKKAIAAVKKGVAKVKAWANKQREKFRKWREKRKNKRKDRKKELENKLKGIVEKLAPEIRNYISKGAGRLRLWGHLRVLQFRHGLTWLNWKRDGSFMARLNPTLPVPGVEGKELSPDELGRLLMPVFRHAEEEYQTHLLEHQQAGPAIHGAIEKYTNNQPGALSGLTDAEQAIVLRHTRKGAVNRLQVTGSAQITIPAGRRHGEAAGLGVVENLGAYKGKEKMVGGVLKRTPDLIDKLSGRAAKFGVGEKELADILAAPQIVRDAKIKQMQTRLSVNKTMAKQSGALGRSLERFSILTKGLETARMPGYEPVSAVSSALLGSGKASLHELYGPEGALAPYTQVGAAPHSGVAKSPEQLEAADKRHERVGEIFIRLKDSASHAGVVVNAGGYDLNGLVTAIDRFLTANLNGIASERELKKAERALRAEIQAMLIAHHGR